MTDLSPFRILRRRNLYGCKNKELTEVEWSSICELASRRGSELVDYFNLNKRDMKDGLLEIVDILSDDTR
jgi:hypothetical protein